MEYVISIDMGATNLRVGIVSSDLEIIEVNREKTTKNNKDALVEQICRMIDALPYEKYNVKKVGISACGLIERNYIKILPNLGIKDLDLQSVIQQKYGFKCEIKNDANCTALAEATFGSSKDVKDSFFITISSGIGGCLIYDGEMVDLAFEIGHKLLKYNNYYEEFEKIASGNGIVKLCSDNYLIVEHAGEFFSLCKQGDQHALQILDQWKEIVSLYLANVQMEYNVDKIVLSGGVMKSSDLFINDLELRANNLISKFPLKPVNIVLAHFDQDAGLMGGVSVALHIK